MLQHAAEERARLCRVELARRAEDRATDVEEEADVALWHRLPRDGRGQLDRATLITAELGHGGCPQHPRESSPWLRLGGPSIEDLLGRAEVLLRHGEAHALDGELERL